MSNILSTTPMMRQYFSIKEAHKEYLLFYRMGDFYELFFDDAILGAKELDIALTKRGKQDNLDIPMCGVPVHSSEIYIQRLIKKGYSIAICEQLETPEEAKKRGSKSVVRREVIRIVTPGTILDESLLEAKESNYLASIFKNGAQISLAWVDISLGECFVETLPLNHFNLELMRLLPREVIISDKLYQDPQIKEELKYYDGCLTRRADSMFDFTRGENKLKEFLKVKFLSGISTFSKEEIIAVGSLLEYIEYTQKANMPNIHKVVHVKLSNFLAIDYATRVNLELERSIKKQNNSLYKTLDETITAAGGRLLSSYLASPLANAQAINERLDNVESWVVLPEVRRNLRHTLSEFTDIERALSRISAKRGTFNDLALIREGLKTALKIAELIHAVKCSAGILAAAKQIVSFDNLLDELKAALSFSLMGEGIYNIGVRPGYNAQLDSLNYLKVNSNEKIDQLRGKYKNITNINSLKIQKNNVIGYFIEVPPGQAEKVKDPVFIHKQSLGNSIRYTTKELQELESELLACDDKILQLEQEILKDLCQKVLDSSDNIILTAQSIAIIDLSSALAEVAVKYNYIRPIIDESCDFYIKDGRHPVVERSVASFIPNACTLAQKNKNIWLLTGPNMAGKSTFLRQNALICVMAQLGSFVPAFHARIGVVDKLFSRIGASDNISYGQSTFMVEMLETAYILNNATERSFIILDEIGRGTSTYDGLAIAWAVVEHINNNIKARTLFATHYHELTQLEEELPRLKCYTMKVQEWGNKIVFMHEVLEGKANKSYGIHVAELAGMPPAVTKRAYEILEVHTIK